MIKGRYVRSRERERGKYSADSASVARAQQSGGIIGSDASLDTSSLREQRTISRPPFRDLPRAPRHNPKRITNDRAEKSEGRRYARASANPARSATDNVRLHRDRDLCFGAFVARERITRETRLTMAELVTSAAVDFAFQRERDRDMEKRKRVRTKEKG